MNLGTKTKFQLQKSLRLLDAIRLHETLFALPFAYTGMILAANGFPSWKQFAWITVAMVSARILGMCANRIIDRNIDAKNIRTSNRHLPSGRLQLQDMVILATLATAFFFLSAFKLNSLSFFLAPIAAGYIIVYPYTKRFTWAANIMLGWALAIAPTAAWIGVLGSLSWKPVLLSTAVASWASSFDIIYHTQDRDFYIRNGLYSIAQRFGMEGAFHWTRALDIMAVSCLILLGIWMNLSYPYFIGCLLTSGLMLFRYVLVSPYNLAKMDVAFYGINAFASLTIFVGTLIAIMWV